MRIIADLHVHSKYARATSPTFDLNGIAEGAKLKGIDVVATGDFTHPKYFEEIKATFGTGVDIWNGGLASYAGVRFILSTEVSVIYELGGKNKKMHHVILAPNLEIAAQINERTRKFGDIGVDGRPMLHMRSAALVEELMQISREIVIIPAHCLLPGTAINCNPNIKNIEDIKEGERVYTHTGQTKKVTKTYKRKYCGEIYKTIPWYFSLGVTSTAEHPIYAIKTVKNCSWSKGLVCKPTISHLRVCYQHFYEQYKPQWVLARDIEKGDVLVYPRLRKIKDISSIPINYKFRDAVTQRSVGVNKEFCRLIGYYLSEGYSNGRDAIAFAFNSNETDYLLDVKKLMKTLFNIQYKPGKTDGDIIFYSRSLVHFFENLFYIKGLQKRAFAKYLPDWALELPMDKQAEILRGWWRGDKGSTSSKVLANQMKTICLRLGIIPGISVDSKTGHKMRGKHKIKNRDIIAAHDNFVFHTLTFFEDEFNLLKESEFKEFDYKRDVKHGWIDENNIYLPVRKIEKLYYDGYVYNLEVEDDNSYLTEFAAVHNCWTPWFSVFGSSSGVDSIEEAFEDKADKIFALETGLSSDPLMNWMISALDKYTLVSNSDAHSKPKLGREANVFEFGNADESDAGGVTYGSLINAIKTRKGFVKTYEFYPEEGKYHYDGHRDCKVNITPWQAKEYKNICPVCRRKLTIGVMHRVADLADRKLGFKPENAVPFQHIVPLPTVIAKALKKSEAAKAVWEEYDKLIRYFGNEFAVYEAKDAQLRLATSVEISNAIIRVNKGEVRWVPGHDGVFGELVLDAEPKGKKVEMVDKKQTSLGEF